MSDELNIKVKWIRDGIRHKLISNNAVLASILLLPNKESKITHIGLSTFKDLFKSNLEQAKEYVENQLDIKICACNNDIVESFLDDIVLEESQRDFLKNIFGDKN